MKRIYITLIIILVFSINGFSQYKNSFYTHVSDSVGYQSYYAIEIFRKGKPVEPHYREAMFVKFTYKRKPVKGRWYFKNYPDTIIVKRKDDEEDLTIAINSLSTIAFKTRDNYTGLRTAAAMSAMGGGANPGLIYSASNNWSSSYLLVNDKWEAKIVIKKETEKEKLKREKTEKENQEKFERKQKRKNK